MIKGAIQLYGNGDITIQVLGGTKKNHNYPHQNIEFGGDCIFYTQ